MASINGSLTEAMWEWEQIRLCLLEGTVFGVPFESAPWAQAFRDTITKRMHGIAGTFSESEIRFLFYMPANHEY